MFGLGDELLLKQYFWMLDENSKVSIYKHLKLIENK